MRCSRVRERLSEYLDGSIAEKHRRQVKEHLERCSDCQREFERMKVLDDRLRSGIPAYWENIEPSPLFLDRLRHLDLESGKRPEAGIIDQLLSVWQGHRISLSAGLAICVVIALSIAIPSLYTGNDDHQTTIAERAPGVPESPPTGPHGLAIKGSTSGSENVPEQEMGMNDQTMEYSIPGPTVAETPAPSEQASFSSVEGEGTEHEECLAEGECPEMVEEIVPSPESVPTPSIVPAPTLPGEFEVVGVSGTVMKASCDVVTDKSDESPAVAIALSDEDVKTAIEGHDISYIMVCEAVDRADYVCDGTTVIIGIDQPDPPETELYVCVNSGSGTVTHLVFLPLQP